MNRGDIPDMLTEVRRARARRNLLPFTQYTFPQYRADPAHALIASTLDRVVNGEIKRLIICAPPQHGKCIAQGTPVLLADGSRVPIEKIKKGDLVITLDDSYNLASAPVTSTFSNGDRPVLRFTLRSGRYVECTENHPVMTVAGWRKCGELTAGDAIAMAREAKFSTSIRTMPEGFPALLGYLVGDGSFGQGNPIITTSEPKIVEHLQAIASVHGWVVRNRDKYSYHIRKPKRGKHDGSSAQERLRKYMAPSKSINKRVPDCILMASREELCEFLAAYFNCDATVTDNREGVVEFYSVSEWLLRDVQHLLTRLGIYSTLRTKRGRYKGEVHWSWRLIVRGTDMISLAEQLPAIGKRGEKLRSVAEAGRNKWRNPEHEAIPVAWRGLLKNAPNSYRTNHGMRIDKKYKYGTDRRLVQKVAEIEDNNELRRICNKSIVWEPIVKIENTGVKPTYDIEVPATRNFVCNDIVVHNSELASVRFPAYWLARNPNLPFILCSYAASLADTKSRQARQLVESQEFSEIFPSVRTRPDSRAVDHWEIAGYRGFMRVAGVGGPITGHGAFIGLVDDPLENWEQAQSTLIRDKIWDWYRTTFRTRIWEGGAIVLIQTRWHADDLAGRLMADRPGEWAVLRLPALAETQEERDANNQYLGLPTGAADPLGRQPGQPLCPTRFSRKALEEFKRDVGSLAWAAQYQGVPRAAEGNRFKRHWFPVIERAPICDRYVRYWDKAGSTKTGADYSAGVLMGWSAGQFNIIDVVRGQWSPHERNEIMLATAQQDNAMYDNVATWTEQEPGSGGLESALITVQQLAGFAVFIDKVSGSKEVRAEPLAAQAEAGNVALVKGNWISQFLDEITAFPNGSHDDQCLIAGTLVRTANGDAPIESIRAGDLVLTRNGYKPVLWSGQTGISHSFVRLSVRNGASLIATPNHPIWTDELGFIRIDSMCGAARTGGCENQPFDERRSASMGCRSIAIRTLQEGICGATIGHTQHSKEARFLCTERFGSPYMGRSQRGSASTTKMATPSTTLSTILNASATPSICRSMLAAERFPQNPKSGTFAEFGTLPQPGTLQKRGSHGTSSMLSGAILEPQGKRYLPNAQCAALSSRPWQRSERNTAQRSAHGRPSRSETKMEVKFGSACNAAKHSVAIDTEKMNTVATTAFSFSRVQVNDPVPVYNLTVSDSPEFFANGILVHNCDAASGCLNKLTLANTGPSGIGVVSTVDLDSYLRGYNVDGDTYHVGGHDVTFPNEDQDPLLWGR